jgi:hypothetical protein
LYKACLCISINIITPVETRRQRTRSGARGIGYPMAPIGTGECGIKTGGNQKERISTQFDVYADGRKEQPFIIYHATEAA